MPFANDVQRHIQISLLAADEKLIVEREAARREAASQASARGLTNSGPGIKLVHGTYTKWLEEKIAVHTAIYLDTCKELNIPITDEIESEIIAKLELISKAKYTPQLPQTLGAAQIPAITDQLKQEMDRVGGRALLQARSKVSLAKLKSRQSPDKSSRLPQIENSGGKKMGFNATVLRVMIASPGDVQEERRAATEEINDWNALHSASRNIVLLPDKWETNTNPQYGAHPQALVNKQILDRADILVGIFGMRLGTQTPDFQSGTVEEITRHADRQKSVKLYFSEAPLPRDYDREQYAALVSYRDECRLKSWYTAFRDTDDFRRQFRRHLAMELNEARYAGLEITQSAIPSPSTSSQPLLSEAAETILKQAASKGGDILVRNSIGLNTMSAGGQQFGKGDNSPRTVALWTAALEELKRLGFVAHSSGPISKVTNAGYKYVDSLDPVTGY
ncbi:DUF4062 domain-containing protein [Granulicella sp. dw_53]|uniref:DUF4062 domain-containing protein n=1 Tax=Granulicella sp. dw_53 TaxID=2719792 RepID=UPI001BD1E844|nr:DUF4062 domain-containing protein [Granulicella sp. dw_53]